MVLVCVSLTVTKFPPMNDASTGQFACPQKLQRDHKGSEAQLPSEARTKFVRPEKMCSFRLNRFPFVDSK